MATKLKTIKLSYPHYPKDITDIMERNKPENLVWAVVQITDSTDFNPGQQLKRQTVDELCASSQWRVTIVPNK